MKLEVWVFAGGLLSKRIWVLKCAIAGLVLMFGYQAQLAMVATGGSES